MYRFSVRHRPFFIVAVKKFKNAKTLRQMQSLSPDNLPTGTSQVALVIKKLLANAGDMRPDLVPGLERSPGEGNGNPLQYSCLENPMDRRAWWATAYRVANSWTRQQQQPMKQH